MLIYERNVQIKNQRSVFKFLPFVALQTDVQNIYRIDAHMRGRVKWGSAY